MEIGLRVLALVIDLAVCFGTLPGLMFVINWLVEKCGPAGIVLLPVWIVAFFVWPVLCLAVPTGLWGRSLGKLICRLKVTDQRGDPPGIWRALGRETLKLLAVSCGFGAMITLFMTIHQGAPWYDFVCGTTVEFTPVIRLSQTQKNFRKHMKQRKADLRRQREEQG